MNDLMEKLEPALYLVPVPIGNREDITLRALRILRSVDVIACEDTRECRKLLSLYQIDSPKLVAIHEHNEKQSVSGVLDMIADGKSVAYCSDAGMPGICDPGFVIVRE